MDNKKPTRGFPQVGCDDARDNRHYSPIHLKSKAHNALKRQSNGAIGDAFYSKMFGKVRDDK